MSFVVSVAAGAEVAENLHALCHSRLSAGEVAFVRHRELAVAWATGCPWVEVEDDGNTLVVLDGRLHNLPAASEAGPATQVLGRYRDRALDVARDLLGDFILVILDRVTATLMVARDPVGVRPWYQARATGGHAGASDVATLTALPGVNTGINEKMAIEYLAAVEESRGETLYRGIRTLRPGHTWRNTSRGAAAAFPHHRWDLRPEVEISWDEAVERSRAVFAEAVRCRVVGQATSQLSGGLDSSAVVGTLALLGRDDLLVGRLIFDGRADERGYSDAVIDHWGVPAVSDPPWIPTEHERWDLSQKLQRPLPDPNFTMFVGLHRTLVARGRPEGLTGLGGDDAFVASGIGPRVMSAVQLRQKAVLLDLARWTTRNLRRSWTDLMRPTLGYLAAPRRLGRTPSWVTRTAAARAGIPHVMNRRPQPITGVDAIDHRIDNLTGGYDASILEAQALVTDQLGRRDSHPFLDPRFIRATYGLDPWWPVRGGHHRALEVAVFKDRLPSVVAERRTKVEFSEVFWPQVLDDSILARVSAGPLSEAGWLDPGGFETLVVRARQGKANAVIPLSRCISLDQWMRMHV